MTKTSQNPGDLSHLTDWQCGILRAGRKEWPAKTTRISPWLTVRMIKDNEVWFVWTGSGTASKDGHSFALKGGDLLFLHKGHAYEVQQDPHHPLGVNFIQFEITPVAGQAESEGITILKGLDRINCVDTILAEALSRRVTELLWEAYVDFQVTSAKDQDQDDPVATPEEAAAVPNPSFTNEDELTRHSAYCPTPIMISVPQDSGSPGALVPANSLLRSLLTEAIHQSQREHIISPSGLEKYQRKLVTSIAMEIQEKPGEFNSIAELAQRVGYSPDHFSRTFKKIMGYGPRQFLLNARIAKSRQLLRESDMSIKEIASLLGYCSTFFFSRQFKEFTALTPREYRQQARDKSVGPDDD